MLDFDAEDSLTTLNTALNKSMVLMESPIDRENKKKGTKSITINTKVQPPNMPGSTPDTIRRSILKKSKNHDISDDEDSSTTATSNNADSNTRNISSISNCVPRPHNLQDFLKEDNVLMNPTHSTFNLEELSDSEELWVMDVPKTVNPRTLKGQTLLLGEKSKLKVGEERYCAVNRDSTDCLTCVFSTGKEKKPYRAVNIKPAGSFTVRRKLAGVTKRPAEMNTSTAVPFPQNLKIRHPFFVPDYNKKMTT